MTRFRLTMPLVLAVLIGGGALFALGLGAPVSADEPQNGGTSWIGKSGGWTDYAPNGIPDFDQTQDPGWAMPAMSGAWSHCGPVAAANSVWWFDSKFEPRPVPPLAVNDNYGLVSSYNPGGDDDHSSNNVVPFVNNLACYFDTNGLVTGVPIFGTEVHSMSVGLQRYLFNDPSHVCASPSRTTAGSYYDEYHVQLVKMPTFEWVTDEISRSEDVILLLGFWQQSPLGGGWYRVGGHFVTVAGISPDPTAPQIALSDPITDAAEYGGAGFVYSGTWLAHAPIPGHPPFVHNDAGNVSHDVYPVTLAAVSPGGLWEIGGYPYDPTLAGKNVPFEMFGMVGTYEPALPVFVEVEYALTMSPFYWKAGGEWVHLHYGGEWIWEWWWYEDDGDSCMPDFPAEGNGGSGKLAGPAAAANSLWWFDSKAETLVTGGWPVAPPTISDHYPLVTAYDGGMDDHSSTNSSYLVNDLAENYMDAVAGGVAPSAMQAGINDYLLAHLATADFYTVTMETPDWEWIADEVEMSEDVILLLGLYERADGAWERKGGTWVNAAGVNRDYGQLGVSDPLIDYAMGTSISTSLRLGRVFPPERHGLSFTANEKYAPQNISHDIYQVRTALALDESLALAGYPDGRVLTYVIGFNGGGSAVVDDENPIEVVVEWAMGVSPYSDLVITKTVAVTQVVPGDPVTYTLEYANYGLAPAYVVSVTDLLPVEALTDLAYVSIPPLAATPGFTYVWSLEKLVYGQQGIITITGTSLVTAALSNRATITGQTAIGGPTPDKDPDNNSDGSEEGGALYIPVTIKDR